jgi:ABC-2 type transport system permease protein
MIGVIKKYSAVIRMTWIQALEYKANSMVGTFAIVTGLFIEYLIWKLIFASRQGELVNGFNFESLIVYIFLCLIVGQLKSSWVTSSQMIEDIREGGLNKYLIRPISYYAYNFALFIGSNSLFYLVYSVLIIALPFVVPAEVFQTSPQIFGFLFTLLISIYLSYTIYFSMVCLAFWFGEVNSLVTSYNLGMIVLSGQMIPLQLFPESALRIINMTPLPYLVDLPVSIATGRLPVEDWWTKIIGSIVWAIIMTFVGLSVYRKGIRHYEGFGG